MLKNIPKIITPELLKILSEMGHGDEITIGDGNYPAESVGMDSYVVRCDALDVPTILDAILTLFPLDTFVDDAVFLMDKPADVAEPPIWSVYRKILASHGYNKEPALIERFDFYDKSRRSYSIVATGEAAIYANIILKKGVITE